VRQRAQQHSRDRQQVEQASIVQAACLLRGRVQQLHQLPPVLPRAVSWQPLLLLPQQLGCCTLQLLQAAGQVVQGVTEHKELVAVLQRGQRRKCERHRAQQRFKIHQCTPRLLSLLLGGSAAAPCAAAAAAAAACSCAGR
jgi:hypothetical protein